MSAPSVVSSLTADQRVSLALLAREMLERDPVATMPTVILDLLSECERLEASLADAEQRAKYESDVAAQAVATVAELAQRVVQAEAKAKAFAREMAIGFDCDDVTHGKECRVCKAHAFLKGFPAVAAEVQP